MLVVWELDRLSRSLKDLLHIMERVREAGAGFRSLTEAVDTTTAAGPPPAIAALESLFKHRLDARLPGDPYTMRISCVHS